MEKNMDELARQLRCPSGPYAREVGDNMFQSNFNMICKTVEALNLTENENILEIGFGNGKHLPHLLSQAAGLSYRGVDISEAMVQEARENNPSEDDRFFLTDGSGKLDFPAEAFAACFTVNTVYFWTDVAFQLAEIRRVLKPSGRFTMAFIEQEFGQRLPFTQTGFTFYGKEELSRDLLSAGFEAISYEDFTENVFSKDGQAVVRPFTVLTAL
ncbi:MAG: class I SAM-dependent methyltransferase [Leadbetterella sp.]|nr:class I SAM-dependent methyltransferase [Leadbetterella sp.]